MDGPGVRDLLFLPPPRPGDPSVTLGHAGGRQDHAHLDPRVQVRCGQSGQREPKAQIRVLDLHRSPPTSFLPCFYFLPAPGSQDFLVPSLRPKPSFPDVASPWPPPHPSPQTKLPLAAWPRDARLMLWGSGSGVWPASRSTPSPTLPTTRAACTRTCPSPSPLSPPARPCRHDDDKGVS